MKIRIFFMSPGSGGSTGQTSTNQTVENQQQNVAANQTTAQNQTTNQTVENQQQKPVVYVSLDEVNAMLDKRDAENLNKLKSEFEKKELVSNIKQDLNLKNLLDKKFPKWDEKPLQDIQNLKTLYDGIVQTQMVVGANQKPGNTSTQNTNSFVPSGDANADYENYCKFKRKQKQQQRNNTTVQNNNTTNK